MQEFEIRLRSVQDVQEFVALATNQAFSVMVGNTDHQVNGKSFMEMFCLDFTRPLIASVEWGDKEYEIFYQAIQKFLVK